MTTSHPATIQDSSQDLWNLAGSDLLVLADRTGKLVALHSKAAISAANRAKFPHQFHRSA